VALTQDLQNKQVLPKYEPPNTACIGQVRAFAHTFGNLGINGGGWYFCLHLIFDIWLIMNITLALRTLNQF
jgi:hypothetical protein